MCEEEEEEESPEPATRPTASWVHHQNLEGTWSRLGSDLDRNRCGQGGSGPTRF